MKYDCKACGIEHASAIERDEIHGAVRRVRAYFREHIRLIINPPKPIEIKPTESKWGKRPIVPERKEKEA